MIIAKKPVSGTTKENLELARPETERVLNFRGTVDSVNVLNGDIEIKISMKLKWYLPIEGKVIYLKEWISAKVRPTFKVVSVST
jgi:hypothetical protein